MPTANARARARRLFTRLEAAYPDARCALNFRNPFELLVATVLSAQCTDEAVNKATPALFAACPDPAAMAGADVADIEQRVKTCGFYRTKARNIHTAAGMLVERHGGCVPANIDDLLALPGVARKTANVVLSNAFGKPDGVVVDTHVGRLAVRLALSDHDQKNAVKVERDLNHLFPPRQWAQLAHLLIAHGRAVCNARKPRCSQCVLKRSCPKIGVERSA